MCSNPLQEQSRAASCSLGAGHDIKLAPFGFIWSREPVQGVLYSIYVQARQRPCHLAYSHLASGMHFATSGRIFHRLPMEWTRAGIS